MRVLKLSPYCDPEKVSSSHLTTDLNDAFIQSGFTIENYVPTPTRGVSKEVREKYKKLKSESLYDGKLLIYRFSMFGEGKSPILRAVRYVLVNFVQYLKGCKAKNIDVIFSGSTPPTQGLLCGLVKKKLKVPFVYNLQDIFPDSLVNTGLTREGSIIWKIGRKIENFTYNSADKIIVISDDFKKNIMDKGVPEEKIVVVPNWVNTDNVYPISKQENILFDRYGLDRNLFYISYCGNIGHSQNLELLLDAAQAIDNPSIRFLLVGEGIAKEALQKNIKERNLKNVIVLPFQPYEDIAHVFSIGDVGLIISKPGIGVNSVPSKTWSIMAAERPVLASFDENSLLSRSINEIGCGVVVKAGELKELVKCIYNLYDDREHCVELGIRGRKYIEIELSKNNCVNKYIDAINSLIKKGGIITK